MGGVREDLEDERMENRKQDDQHGALRIPGWVFGHVRGLLEQGEDLAQLQVPHTMFPLGHE